MVPALSAERPVNWPKRVEIETRQRASKSSSWKSHSIPRFHGQFVLPFRRSRRFRSRAPWSRRNDRDDGSYRHRENAPAARSKRILRRLGADLSSSAGQDTRRDFVLAASVNLPSRSSRSSTNLAREASFPEAEFERERRQKLEEVKLKTHGTRIFSRAKRFAQSFCTATIHTRKFSASENGKFAAYKNSRICKTVYRESVHAGKMARFFSWATSSRKAISRIRRKKSLRRGPGKKAPPRPCLGRSGKTGAAARRLSRARSGRGCRRRFFCGCHSITRRHPDWGEARPSRTACTEARSTRGS